MTQVRSEVAHTETAQFDRVVQRLRSQVSHYKAQAALYKRSFEDTQRQHEQVQAALASLVAYNRELFFSAERSCSLLATRVDGQRPFFRKFQVATVGGHVWRAWKTLCVNRRRHSCTLLFVYRRKAWRWKQATLCRWKDSAQLQHTARWQMGAWRRAVGQQQRGRQRRENVVMFGVLSRRARGWKLEVLSSWRHATMFATIKRRKKMQMCNRLSCKQMSDIRESFQTWGKHTYDVIRLQRVLSIFHRKKTTTHLQNLVGKWAQNTAEETKLRDVISSVLFRTARNSVFSAWRQRICGMRWRQETLAKIFW